MTHGGTVIDSPGPPGYPELVTVLVMSYNQARYVATCLDSIVACHWPMLEIVVVDDGSIDASRDVIAHWIAAHPDTVVRPFLHGENRGLCNRLNEGVATARGATIILLAADDELLPHGIESRVRYLAERPEKLAVFGDAQVIDDQGVVVHDSAIEGLYGAIGARRAAYANERLLPDALVFTWGVPGATFAWRRGALEFVGGYDANLVVEDWEMYLRLASVGGLGFVDECVGRYRVHTTNVSRTRSEAVAHDLAAVAARYRSRFRGLTGLRLAVYSWRAPSPKRGPRAQAFARYASHTGCRILLRVHFVMRSVALRRLSTARPLSTATIMEAGVK